MPPVPSAQPALPDVMEGWIRAALREAASSELRRRVMGRARRPGGALSGDGGGGQEEVEAGGGPVVEVTEKDISAAAGTALRVGLAWAAELRRAGLGRAAGAVLEVAGAGAEALLGEQMEEEEEEEALEALEAAADEEEVTAPGTGGGTGGIMMPAEASLTASAALSRLGPVAPLHPALLLDPAEAGVPYGRPRASLPPNPVADHAVATLAGRGGGPASRAGLDRWRSEVLSGLDRIGTGVGQDGGGGGGSGSGPGRWWSHPWDVVDGACRRGEARSERARLRARARARARLAAEPGRKKKEPPPHPRPAAAPPPGPRPPSDRPAVLSLTVEEVASSLGTPEELARLERECLHPAPPPPGGGPGNPPPRPSSPGGQVSGYLHHVGHVQLYEAHRRRSYFQGAESPGRRATVPAKATRGTRGTRRRLYRAAKRDRLLPPPGTTVHRTEGARGDRTAPSGRASRAVWLTEGKGAATSAEAEAVAAGGTGGGREWLELDLGGCLVVLGGDEDDGDGDGEGDGGPAAPGGREILAFRSIEASLLFSGTG